MVDHVRVHETTRVCFMFDRGARIAKAIQQWWFDSFYRFYTKHILENMMKTSSWTAWESYTRQLFKQQTRMSLNLGCLISNEWVFQATIT